MTRLSAGVLVGVSVLFGGVAAVPIEAGLIPWTYNAIFGHGPVYGGYPYAAPVPAYGMTAYGAPSWGPTAVPATSMYGPVLSVANPCCDPCPTPCDPCRVGGPCPTGNCGVSFPPSERTKPAPDNPAEPTEAPPTRSTPPTFRTDPPPRQDPPPDDFRPAVPREQDNTVPDSSIPNRGRSNPPAVPDGGTNSPPPQNPEEEFLPPGARPPAPGEPADVEPASDQDDIVPFLPNTKAAPLDVAPAAVASMTPARKRIVVQAGYRIPSVVRVRVAPETHDEGDVKLVRK